MSKLSKRKWTKHSKQAPGDETETRASRKYKSFFRWLTKQVQTTFMNHRPKRPLAKTKPEPARPPSQAAGTQVATPIKIDTTTNTHEQEMTTISRRPAHTHTPSENWDDDFEFQHDDNDHHDISKQLQTRHNQNMQRSATDSAHDNNGDNVQSTQPSFTRRSGAGTTQRALGHQKLPEAGPSYVFSTPLMSNDSANMRNPLQSWSEPEPLRTPLGQPGQAENWDDDFEDRFESPARTHRSQSRPHHSDGAEEHENWDEDFEMATADSPTAKRALNDTSWDSSEEDEENNFDRGFGFADREEDRTVTARSRRAAPHSTPSLVPPVPPLPLLPILTSDPSAPTPFPRSPTLSAFSIPVSGRDSLAYGSTAHLALRPTHSAGSSRLGMLPPSPPVHKERERRRLRKKSRPPHIDGNIIELDDRAELVAPPAYAAPNNFHPTLPEILRPLTPENRPVTPPATSPISVDISSPSTTNSPPSAFNSNVQPNTRSPLLTRIGSVKKWASGAAVRKKRASTGPAEIVSATLTAASTGIPFATSPPSSPPQAPRVTSGASRFFRAGGAPSPGNDDVSPPEVSHKLKKEKSGDRMRGWRLSARTETGSGPQLGQVEQELITKTAGVSTSLSDRPVKVEDEEENVLSHKSQMTLRRPTSVISGSSRTIFPRHVSAPTGRHPPISGIESLPSGETSRSVSASGSVVFTSQAGSTSNENVDNPKEKEGSRGFMGGMRRISLVSAHGQKKHKRTKSGGGNELGAAPPIHVLPQAQPQDSDEALGRVSISTSDHDATAVLAPRQPSQLPVGLSLSTPMPSQLADNRIAQSTSAPAKLTDICPPKLTDISLPLSRAKSFISPISTPTTNRLSVSPSKPPASPQAVSLGRATQAPPSATHNAVNVLRRNSLGDLKIPTRISRAQDGLKRDLNRVRQFAAHVEQMKELQETYCALIVKLQSILEAPDPEPPSRATSPTFFNLPRPRARPHAGSRARSNTNPPPPQVQQLTPKRELAAAFHAIDAKYTTAWECAILLIELGGAAQQPPSTSVSAPAVTTTSGQLSGGANAHADVNTDVNVPKGRERAVTLAGDEGKPSGIIASMGLGVSAAGSMTGLPLASPPGLASWRASTGRHDLSQRQLHLLKVMLNHPDYAKVGVGLEIPEDGPTASLTRHWRWGMGMDSTVTLPSEESVSVQDMPPAKKRRSKLGMTGFRDMLKSLKRNHPRTEPVAMLDTRDTASGSAESCSLDSHAQSQERHTYQPPPRDSQSRTAARRKAKTSTGPEYMRSVGDHPNNPYTIGASVTHRSSPRRPSLASLFRMGQKSKASASSVTTMDPSLHKTVDAPSNEKKQGHSRGTTDDGEDEYSDWDRMDSASDLDVPVTVKALKEGADLTSTVRGKKKHPVHPQDDNLEQRPVTPKRSFNPSQASFWESPNRSLSKVDEQEGNSKHKSSGRLHHSRRPSSRGTNDVSMTVRSSSSPILKEKSGSSLNVALLPDPKLALTPENIKPLLENAREVTSRLTVCVSEVQELLAKG